MTPPAEMDCKSLVELVTDYLEGALPDDERAHLEAHLADCDGCNTYLDQIRTTLRLTGALSEQKTPAEAREAFRHVHRSWRAKA